MLEVIYEVMRDRREFTRRVGILDMFEQEDRELCICPVSVLGFYLPDSIQDLKDLCARDREYHVVSWILESGGETGTFLNSYVAGATFYYLADGDNNPKLAHNCLGWVDLLQIQSRNSGKSNVSP